MKDGIFALLKDLIATVNGQVRLWAVGLTCYPLYYIYEHGWDMPGNAFLFIVVVFCVGILLGLLSVWMAVKARSEQGKMEVRRLDAEVREARLRAGEKDRTIYRVDDE